MDFDEYDYLEKAVEEHDDRDSKRKKKEGSEKEERSYRRKDVDEDAAAGGLEDEERRSKRSRGELDNGRERSSREKDRHRRDKERDRERDRSSKERERDIDGEREKEIERDRNRREKERGREHEKDKERDRKERDREKDRREKDKDREKEREEREKERENERSRRSRSQSDRDREKDRERERELELRESRRTREKKEAEPEADPERDQRTVFAYQMPLKATERDVYEFFSKAGKDDIDKLPLDGRCYIIVNVRDVRLIMDRNSRRSKGVGYIEFYDAMSVPMAIALSGNLMRGQVVMVKPSEAEKNLVQSNTPGGSAVTGPYGATDRKLYVGNLHFNMTETHLREIFEPFGPVELVQLPLDLETGQCKGFGFVQFAQLEHAKAAQSLNGKLELAGRTIKVSSVTDHVGAQDAGAKSADFDDDDGGGLSLNAQSRALLMQKLDRTGIATSIAGSLGVPVLNGAATLPVSGQPLASTPALSANFISPPAVEPVGIPSECLLLKNMFDPASEMDPDFDADIKDDVEEECSKYGRVKHIYVDKNSAGCVYLRFEDKNGSSAAQKAMNMRWFAGKRISALFVQPQVYEAKFGAL